MPPLLVGVLILVYFQVPVICNLSPPKEDWHPLRFNRRTVLSSMTASGARSLFVTEHGSILQLFLYDYNWEIANIIYALATTYLCHALPHPNNQRAFRVPPLPRENYLDVTE